MMLPLRKMVFAIKMMGFRPKTSDSLPQKGTDVALASRYAEPVHAYSESGMWKDCEMVGRAVGTSTVSSATRKMEELRPMKAISTWNGGRSRVFEQTVCGVDWLDSVVESAWSCCMLESMMIEDFHDDFDDDKLDASWQNGRRRSPDVEVVMSFEEGIISTEDSR
jgi:hypothetical protein